MAAQRLELELGLDRALCGGTSPLVRLEMVLPMPVAHAADLLAIVRARLERVELAAPALAVTLRAPELARMLARPLDWIEPEAKADHTLPRLVAELAAELGAERVGTLALVDTWVPDERTRLVPFGVSSGSVEKVARDGGFFAVEPTRLVAASAVEPPQQATRVARVASVEWWSEKQSVLERDLLAAWTGSSLAWLEVDAAAAPRLRGWVD
jgi:protein ImuB